MDICLILDKTQTCDTALDLLEQRFRYRHVLRRLGVLELTAQQAIERVERSGLADLYLLKSGTPQALELACYLERRGSTVINGGAASMICEDRTLLSQAMEQVHLPWPRTHSAPDLASLLSDQHWLTSYTFPLIVKSKFSRLKDHISKINTLEELQALALQWGQEPVVIQEFAAGDGWDTKLWAVGNKIFAARRRSPLKMQGRTQGYQLEADEIDPEWIDLVLTVGRKLKLQVYGVDLLSTGHGPLIVDVNPFHSCFGIIGFDETLVDFIERQLLTLSAQRTR